MEKSLRLSEALDSKGFHYKSNTTVTALSMKVCAFISTSGVFSKPVICGFERA